MAARICGLPSRTTKLAGCRPGIRIASERKSVNDERSCDLPPDRAGLEVLLASDPDAPYEARNRVDSLAERLPALTLADLRTVASELVANCVVHGSGRGIRLAVEVVADGRVLGAIGDGGAAELTVDGAVERPADELGLRIIDALASRWGVDRATNDVWFEIPAADQSAGI